MRLYRKARDSAQAILGAFESGRVPKALAQVFVHRTDDSPCRHWSWRNQLLVALSGFDDARGFRQWKHVGRHVRKGETARCHILVPMTVKGAREDSQTGELVEDVRIVGYSTSPVFGCEQTDGEPPPEAEGEAEFLRGLPLHELAQSWGLSVRTYNGQDAQYLGYYQPGVGIALGVENLSTWSHELCHAADDRLGELQKSTRPDREIVAELAGAVLLECLGRKAEADRGGAWEYISSCASSTKANPLTVCTRLLDRVCRVVDCILTEAGQLALVGEAAC